LITPGGYVQGTAADMICHHVVRAQDWNREILSRSEQFTSELIDNIVATQDNSFFSTFEAMSQLSRLQGMNDMSVLTRGIFDYLLLVDYVDRYRREILQTVHPSRPGFIAGSERDSDAGPLRQAIDE
jgi:hypothetical protein